MFFNVWNGDIYSFKFLIISLLLIISILIISYITTQALIKYINNYKEKKELLTKITSINENNVHKILKELNINSSYKLKVKNISNINKLKNLLLKKYYEK